MAIGQTMPVKRGPSQDINRGHAYIRGVIGDYTQGVSGAVHNPNLPYTEAWAIETSKKASTFLCVKVTIGGPLWTVLELLAGRLGSRAERAVGRPQCAWGRNQGDTVRRGPSAVQQFISR